MSKRILITGGNSRIGRKLVRCLIKNNLSVRVLTRKGNNFDFLDALEIVFGDLLSPSSLSAAIQGIDEIIHLAAITHSNDKDEYWRVNVGGTENLIKIAQQAGVNRIIFMSSRAISPAGGAYSQSKLAAEQVVKKSGIHWVILRPSEVYGMGKGEMIDLLIKFIRRSFAVPAIKTNQNVLSPVYIDDIINALEKAVFRKNILNKTYTLSGPEDFSFNGLVEQICYFYKLKRLKVCCPLPLLKLFFRTANSIGLKSFLAYDQFDRFFSDKSSDISLAKNDLDFYPMNFRKGLSLLG